MNSRSDLVLHRASARHIHPMRILGPAPSQANQAHVGEAAADLGTGALLGILILPVILIALFLNSSQKA